MNRLTKIAVLEAAFNHHNWVELKGRFGNTARVLVHQSVRVDYVPDCLEFWTAAEMTASPEELRAVFYGIGELDALESVELMDSVYPQADFRPAFDRLFGTSERSHLRLS